MSDGLSRWWPTPSRPADHFSAAELARSARWHRPVHRLTLATWIVEVAALVAVGLVLGRATASTGEGGPLGDPWPRALVGAVSTVAALRLPGVRAEWLVVGATDEGGSGRRRVGRFLGSATVGAAVQVVALTAVAALAVPRIMGGPLPWLVAGALAAGGLVMALADAAAKGPEEPAVGGSEEGPGPWVGELAGLARRCGVDPVAFVLVDEGGPNACAIGFGARRRVLVDRSLVEGPSATRDFVVAHELAHLARHHPMIRAGLGAAVAMVVLAAPVALAPSGRPWSWFGLRADDPIAVPVAALVVMAAMAAVSPPVAWVLRALERAADAAAMASVGPLDPAAAVELHLASGVELEPPLLSRLSAQHPSPAERVEMIARRRSGSRRDVHHPSAGNP